MSDVSWTFCVAGAWWSSCWNWFSKLWEGHWQDCDRVDRIGQDLPCWRAVFGSMWGSSEVRNTPKITCSTMSNRVSQCCNLSVVCQSWPIANCWRSIVLMSWSFDMWQQAAPKGFQGWHVAWQINMTLVKLANFSDKSEKWEAESFVSVWRTILCF